MTSRSQKIQCAPISSVHPRNYATTLPQFNLCVAVADSTAKSDSSWCWRSRRSRFRRSPRGGALPRAWASGSPREAAARARPRPRGPPHGPGEGAFHWQHASRVGLILAPQFMSPVPTVGISGLYPHHRIIASKRVACTLHLVTNIFYSL